METIQKNYLPTTLIPAKKIYNEKMSRLNAVKTRQKPTSMNNLILWNITKALEKNPTMDLEYNLRAAQERLERDAQLGHVTMSQYPEEEEHLVCALLAWQQLGHNDVESLVQFIETTKSEEAKASQNNALACNNHPTNFIVASNSMNQKYKHHINFSNDVNSVYFGSCSKGPVVKLPIEPKIIMRVDNTAPQCRECPKPKPKPMPKLRPSQNPSTSSKITAACCMDTECAKNLAAMDAETEELRRRAEQLARREAERVELLERAEAAWVDLELGYQRRLRLAEEKEEDMAAQIAKMIQERNEYKDKCSKLAQNLKEVGDSAESERAKLAEAEKTVCDRACKRLKLSEEAAKGEASLAEQQCKAVQLERDLQFKEEQARRKLLTMDNETESARVLMHEAERALRAELGGLRDQIGEVSTLLLEVDEMNKKIKDELDELRQEKADIIEDLEGCKLMCDKKMQSQVDELYKKRKQLDELKEKVMECKCKLPVDVGVEVKRTASLAALCKCTSEDKFSDACSCSSLRSRLISSLLADLFGGLQSELGGVGLQMPCQMLKCLEDKHNWDRSSVIKTNLRNFFSKLLVGELDIAIATAIEKYHAKWTGTSCADELTMKPSPDEDLSHGWEKRALERRAQKLAEELAEQLFQNRADELTAQAKEIVKSGPPPCACNKNPRKTDNAAVLQCCLDLCSPFTHASDKRSGPETPTNWSRTNQDVTQLRLQIENLRKEFIKREDLKLMEENITRIVKKAAVPEHENTINKDFQSTQSKNCKKETKNMKSAQMDESLKYTNIKRIGATKKKHIDVIGYPKKYSINERPTKQSKKYNYNQSYAVNVCMCGPQKPNKILQNTDASPSSKVIASNDIITQVASIKQSKPIALSQIDTDEIISKVPLESSCGSDCKCFHKMPSTASIDRLLETLTQWKCDLADPKGQLLNELKSSLNSKSLLPKNSKSILKNKSINNYSKVDFATTEKVQDEGVPPEMPAQLDENGKKNQVLNFNLAANTTSEYMGAINLDKSNEYVSTCVDTTESNDLIQEQVNDKNTLNECPAQSINFALTESQNLFTDNETQSNDYTKVRVLNEHLYGKIKNATDLNVLTNSKSTRTIKLEDNQLQLKTKEIFNQTDSILNELNKPQISPNNFDYYIKFLGVTLAETDSHNIPTDSGIRDTKDIKKKGKSYSPTINDKGHYADREKQKTETPKLINQLKKELRKENEVHSPLNMEKCECHAKFEEFQRFMVNIFNDQSRSKKTQQKDKALDSPSLKCTLNHNENCACCNLYNADDSRDLEVNAFYLLEDHLKQKLKEFKKCSCKSSCISAQEEEQIFSAILKKVKQVISDCANEAKCNEPGLTTDASLQRAYGLLQEYLKLKIKRAQCSPLLNENKDILVPNILEKVCNLIENDFKRLKELCKCKRNDDTLTKKSLIAHLLLPHEDLPEKDTNMPEKKYDNALKMQSKQNSARHIEFLENIASQVSPGFGMKCFDVMAEANYTVPTVSRQNSTDSVIITQTISLQVPPALGLVTKSCDALEMENKSEQTSNINLAVFNTKSQGIVYNTCDCYYSRGKTDRKSTKKSEVLINFCENIMPQQRPTYRSINNLSNTKSMPNFEMLSTNYNKIYENSIIENHAEESVKPPYLGCTIDCTCNGNLKQCICPKSVIQYYSQDIRENWQQYIANNNKRIQEFAYIMNTSHKINNNMKDMRNDSSSNVQEIIKQRNIEDISVQVQFHRRETEPNDKDFVSLLSAQTVNTSHQNTNASPDITLFTTDLESEESYHNLDWLKSTQIKSEDAKSSMLKLSNDYEPVDESMKSCNSDMTTNTETAVKSQNCNCYKVPICHVKMLVNNIEKNIIESKCTCDSVSKVCPVHTKISH